MKGDNESVCVELRQGGFAKVKRVVAETELLRGGGGLVKRLIPRSVFRASQFGISEAEVLKDPKGVAERIARVKAKLNEPAKKKDAPKEEPAAELTRREERPRERSKKAKSGDEKGNG